jgi:hypothetical protein
MILPNKTQQRCNTVEFYWDCVYVLRGERVIKVCDYSTDCDDNERQLEFKSMYDAMVWVKEKLSNKRGF